MIDPKKIEYFLCVAQASSSSRVAPDPEVSQLMMSRVLQDFELELGHRLFHRTGRGMRLTEFGGRLLPLVRRATLEVSHFVHEAKALSGILSGTVGIGLPGSIAARLVAPLVLLGARSIRSSRCASSRA